jgi:glutamate N-acetyltransferase/amino-acid N-acetyltransferase
VQITVDGDTSTNDCVIGLASGAAGGALISDPESAEAQQLEAAATAILQGMAKSIAWDGEGATCLIECEVTGADSMADANQVARSVVGSSLAKSAIFGHDPNWGRIAAAAGYSGIEFDQDNLMVKLGDTLLMENGQPLDYDAKAASQYLKDTCGKHGTVNIQVQLTLRPMSAPYQRLLSGSQTRRRVCSAFVQLLLTESQRELT